MNSPDIFVHTPKTAGITIRGLLIEKYGPEFVYSNDVRSGRLASMERQGFKADNSQRGGRNKLAKLVTPAMAQAVLAVRDRLIGEKPAEALTKAKAVIGHFSVTAFDSEPGAQDSEYFTVVRDPLARMASHYRYLKQLDHKMAKMRHWGESHDPQRPFAEFAFDERLQNYQSQFTGIDMGRYALVGTFEKLPDFLLEVGLVTSSDDIPRLNETRWQEEIPETTDPGFVRDFKAFHALDYGVYYDVADR